MKINIENSNNKIRFDYLNYGEIFRVDNVVYMKIREMTREGNCVDIESGCLYVVRDGALVEKPKKCDITLVF